MRARLITDRRLQSAIALLLALAVTAGILLLTRNDSPVRQAGRARALGTNPLKTLQHGGIRRSYRLHIPPEHDPTQAAPLAIVLHAEGDSSAEMEQLTALGFDALAATEGFLVAYPDGVSNVWNHGAAAVILTAIDDVGFVEALINDIAAEVALDRDRVYVSGMAAGGVMAYRLACELSDQIAAVAVVAAAFPERLRNGCNPTSPLPVLIMHGTADPHFPWDGGQSVLGLLPNIPQTLDFWLQHNRCPSAPALVGDIDRAPQDGARIRQTIYRPCAAEGEVTLYRVEAGGHTWPGGLQYPPTAEIGLTSRDLDAATAIWAFFSRQLP